MTYLPWRLAAAVAALQLVLAVGAASAYADAANQYIYISKQTPQRLFVIEDGRVLFQSPVNTGIRQSPTPDGRFRIFASYRKRTMKGIDPRNGKKYNDKDVPYAMYFDGGKAIHGFPRRGYGYPQSFGCVELPVYKARELFQLLDGGISTEVVVSQRRPQMQYAARDTRTAPSYPRAAEDYSRTAPSYPRAAENYPRAAPSYPDYASYEYFPEAMEE